MSENKKFYDAIVLGRGPLGLFTSKYLADKKMRILNIDAGHGLNVIKDNIQVNSNIDFRDISHMPSLNSSVTKYSWTGACMGWPRIDIDLIPIDEGDINKSEEYVKKSLNMEMFNFGKNLPINLPLSFTQDIIYANILNDVYMSQIQTELSKSTNYEFAENLIVKEITEVDKSNVEIECSSYPENNFIKFKTKKLFICLGAIESTRLLLCSKNLNVNRKVLGQNLSNHLTFPISKTLTLNHTETKDRYDYINDGKNNKFWPRVILEDSLKENKRFFVYLTEHKQRSKVLNIGSHKSHIFLEKKENKESNLTMNGENLEVNFYIDDDELNSIEVIINEVIDYFKLNKSFFNYKNFSKKEWIKLIETANHPSGTIRMSDNKSDSVVNKFSHIWNHENIFVFGSSTFPRASFIHPTFPALTFAHYSLKNL